MTTEYAGITIIVDEGPNRTIVNIPTAEAVEFFTREESFTIEPTTLFAAVSDPFWSRPPRRTAGLVFNPIGQYTIREEKNPWHPSAPELSADELVAVDRFGIHDEDESEGVW